MTPTDDPDDEEGEPVVPMWRCPDGGHCHHRCEDRCWRVANAEPLSGEYRGDVWPASLVARHRGRTR